jgi:anaerobic selenocysteine-containing dehydrogenase
VLSVRGDADDPMSRGYVCPKVIGMRDLHEDPDRLRAPLVREGGKLREASWEEALSTAATGLARVRRVHGKDALAVYQGNPTAHNLGLLTFGQSVLRSFGTKNLSSASSTDQVPHMVAAHEMFGHPILLPVADLDRTQHLLIVGANPLVSNGSLMTAPDMKRRLADIRARGGRVVVIDPRRTETAEVADEHVFVKPGTDPWFLLSIVHVLFEEKLASPQRTCLPIDGIEELERAARPFSPERCAAITKVEPATTRRLARELGRAERAAVYGRIGICHQEHGTLAAWLVYVLNVVTGNLDRPGGSMFTTPAVDILKLTKLLGLTSFSRFTSRVRGVPEIGGEVPVATLSEEIETPGPGQVRALLTSAGNPVLSSPNGRRLDRALANLEMMVCVDSYVNETTRHAHVILPPVSQVERSHYDVALNAFTVRNFAKFVDAPVSREDGTLHDWEILLELGLRIHLDGKVARPALRKALVAAAKRFAPEGLLDVLLRVGPHGAGILGTRAEGLTLSRLRAAPHGVDLGALEPRLARLLDTPNGRVQAAPARFIAELAVLERGLEAGDSGRAGGGLVLVGRRHLRSNNSWLHNSQALVKGPARCTLLMHPNDARARGVSTGSTVRLTSRVGTVNVPVEVSDVMMDGVVSLPHG